MTNKAIFMKNNCSLRTLLLSFLAFSSLTVFGQRKVCEIENWKFYLGDNASFAQKDFDDASWKNVRIPHDWAISGPFDKEIDKQTVAIEQNGEKEATEKTGRSGSLPWIGCGWYRTTVDISPQTQRAILNFDGAMAEPVVYVNGAKAGEWKYGYNTFNIDITPFLNRASSNNTIAVRLQNVEESSRWYPGAGLFRPVTLTTTDAVAISPWGVNITTLSLNADGTADVELSAMAEGCEGRSLFVEYDIQTDTRQRSVFHSPVLPDGTSKTIVRIGRITPWTPETPCLYNVTVRLYEKNGTEEKTHDVVNRKTGFRTVECNAEKGFALNGKSRKPKGVCLHHDLGMLGAAINKAALVRQIKLLKTMGCDAIRTAHNMPSQMQMDICDSLGMMVMAESFDMWKYPKCKNGYSRFFETWADRDICNLVMANRIHPCIVMWCVGNEIPEQWSAEGAKILRHLQNEVHRYDNTRPVTTGMDRVQDAIKSGFAQVIDVPGLNYRTHIYEEAYSKLGHGFLLGSETASTVSSRGVYKFPVVRYDGKAYSDGQCSSYDSEACWWSNIPEDDWLLQDEKPWVVGEFVWTGFDYLGEPTPYDEYWPSRSSYFGIFDLAGLPKDRYYLYRSRWNTEENTIHLLPHWTWHGREGEVTPVYCYTNFPTAELFVNGVSQGKRSKRTDVKNVSGEKGRITDIADPAIDRYRLRWNDVRYAPGELRVVCYDAAGNVAGEETVRTAGKGSRLVITPDELLYPSCTNGASVSLPTLKADGKDMLFLTVSVEDSKGTPCPTATDLVKVSVKGAATFRGICNGDATSLEVFTNPVMHLFSGKLVVGIQSTTTPGDITVTVKSKNLKTSTIKLKSVL